MWRVNVTELACWLATAWMPLVVLPGSTKLKGSAARPPVGTFMVLSNMRPSSDSRRGRSLGGMGACLVAGGGVFVRNSLLVSAGLTKDLNQKRCGKTECGGLHPPYRWLTRARVRYIFDAGEIGIGAPTSGTLLISDASIGGRVIARFE
jgi:hypothetical protein